MHVIWGMQAPVRVPMCQCICAFAKQKIDACSLRSTPDRMAGSLARMGQWNTAETASVRCRLSSRCMATPPFRACDWLLEMPALPAGAEADSWHLATEASCVLGEQA